MSHWAVILAGGVGSRFWPLSTPERPKQLLPLVTEQPLLRDTVDRLLPLAGPAHTLILTNASLTAPIARLLPELPRENIIAEPKPSGTAAALVWAAHQIARRDGAEAVMLSVHADWAVADAEGFRAALSRAADAASKYHALVTVGVVPARPDPGFGYIQPDGDVEPGVRRVSRFVEKPDRARAQEMLRDGFLWNSGIFVWRVGDLLKEVRAHTPEVAPALAAHPDDIDGFFGAVRSVSIDVGVLERSDRVMVVAGNFGWDDVGTWGALHRVRHHDAQGNALNGDVHTLDACGNVVHAESSTVVLYGVENLVVVAREGMVLVTTVERSAELKRLMDSLPPTVWERV